MHYDLTLEQYILSCMVTFPECAEEVELLDEKDFCDPTNKKIFNTIRALVKEDTSFDLMLLIAKIGEEVNSHALAFLAETSPSKTLWGEYVAKLKDLTTKRRLNALAESIRASQHSGEETAELVEKEIFSIQEGRTDVEFADLNDLLLDVLYEIEDSQKGNSRTGLETGFKKLDALTDGLQKQDYILIGARPSMGKTAFALNITSNVAEKGGQVAFFSLEMSNKQVAKRIVLSKTRINDYRVKNKELDTHDFTKMASAVRDISNTGLKIIDKPAMTVAQIKSMCRKLKRNEGLDLVVIDYLQLIRSKEGNGRREQVEAVSRDLKAMAKELDVPVVVISSLSRANEVRNNKRPILSDLRETGQIEFDADLIMFLHRENYYDPEFDPNHAELIIAKARNGSLGVVNLNWIGGLTLFEDMI